jgi:hypothetical protein
MSQISWRTTGEAGPLAAWEYPREADLTEAAPSTRQARLARHRL